MKPILLSTKDVMQYSGKSAKYSRALLLKIRNHFEIPDHLSITVFHFCDYHRISVEAFFSAVNYSSRA
jgi:hypothetical protein